MSICCVGSCLNDVMHCDTLGLGSRYRYIPRALLLVLRSGDEVCTDKFCTDSESDRGPGFRYPYCTDNETLVQCFPTGVPRHTRVPQGGPRSVPPILIFQWTFGLF
jgi:hypothetical protein